MIKCWNRTILILALLASSLSLPLFAQENILQEEQDYRFAEQLADKGMKGLAALQFIKYADNFPTSPRAPQALFNAALNYESIDSLGRASQVYLKLFFKYPNSSLIDQAQFHQAKIMSVMGEHEKAGLMFERIRLFTPESDLVPRAQLLAAEEFLAAGKLRSAKDAAFTFLEDFPTHPLRFEAHYILAKIFGAQQQVQVALERLNRIAGERIDDELTVKAQLLRSRLLQKIGRYTAADSVLQAIVDSGLKSDSVGVAAVKLANSYHKRGQYDRSDRIIQKALQLELPTRYQAQLQVIAGDNFYRQEKIKQAFTHYQNVPDDVLKPRDRLYLIFRRGTVAARLGNSQTALGYFKTIIDEADSLNRVSLLKYQAVKESANILTALNRSAEALRALRQFLDQSASEAYKDKLLFQIAEIQQSMQDYAGARRTLAIILELFPNSSLVDDAQLRIARLYENEKAYDLALTEYKRYLSQYPGADEAQRTKEHIALLQKFKPVDANKANAAINNVLVQNLLGSDRARILSEWAEAQVYTFHNFPKAISLIKKTFTLGENSGVDKGKLLYLMGYSHAMLAQMYDAQHLPQQANAHFDSLMTIVSVLEKSFAASGWTVQARYLLIQKQLQKTADLPPRIALLDSSIHYLRAQQAPDSLLSELEYDLAKSLLLKSYNDSTRQLLLAKADSICSLLPGRLPDPDLQANALFLHAMVSINRAKYDTAVVMLQDYLEKYPQSPQIVLVSLQLADLYDILGNLEKAKSLYRQVFRSYFYSRQADRARVRYADILIRQNRVKEATLFLERAFPITDNSELASFISQRVPEDALWMWVKAKKAAGPSLQAMNALRQYLSVSNNEKHRAEALFYLGEMAMQMNDKEVALGHFEELIRTFPQDTLAKLALVKSADLYFDRSNYKAALKKYKSVQNKLSGDLLKHAFAREVICEYRLGNPGRAKNLAAAFKKKFDDRNVVASFLYEEGSYHLKKKNFKQAEKIFKELVKKYNDVPEGGKGELGLGRLYVILNKTDEALKILTRIPDKYKDPEIVATAYLNLGDFYYQNRQLENCIFALRKVLQLQKQGPNHEQALRLLISAYDDVQLYDRAIALARQYVKLYPNSSFYISKRIDIGLFLIKLKEYDRAIAYFRDLKPIVDAETEPQIQYWIAKAYSESGQTEEAIIEFLKVKYLSKPTKLPWGDTALYEAAQAYRKLGNPERARDLFKEIIRSRGTSDQIGRVASEKLREIEEQNE